MPGLKDVARRIRGYEDELSELEAQLLPFNDKANIATVEETLNNCAQTKLALEDLKKNLDNAAKQLDMVKAVQLAYAMKDDENVTKGDLNQAVDEAYKELNDYKDTAGVLNVENDIEIEEDTPGNENDNDNDPVK